MRLANAHALVVAFALVVLGNVAKVFVMSPIKAVLRLTLLSLLAVAPKSLLAQAVTTYHNDTLRTGWNSSETSLTVASVGGGMFGLQATVKLDGQVDSEPLVVPNQVFGNHSARTIVYVVTSQASLYAIDGNTGGIIARRNFGTPVPQAALPGQCDNNGPTIGISSTPVIDPVKGVIYLLTDTYRGSTATFRVHALSLSNFKDIVPSAVVTASAKLSDGTSYVFNPNVSRQRAALLLSGSNLYAAFSSYCDQAADRTRGWLLAWNSANLSPLPHNNLTDAVPGSKSNVFLNTIWMSGYGPSTASPGDSIYVVTSNSDQNTYGPDNIDESVLKLSSDLVTTQSFFTDPNQRTLDQQDNDLGSGGVMLTPQQPGLNPSLAFAAGKVGTMYMFDRSANAGLKSLGSYQIGGCWCGPSYFTGSDGVGRIVSSGGSQAIVWRINTSSSAPASLSKQASTQIVSGQEGGFFTSVSSNGTNAGTAIVWAVGRPAHVPGTLPLYAIDPSSGQILYSAVAGNWISGNSNANTVPTVANGHVYVASYQQLTIFGLGKAAHNATSRAQQSAAVRERTLAIAGDDRPLAVLGLNEHVVWGTIRNVSDAEIVIADRNGALIHVDPSRARASGNVAEPVVGQAARVIGTRTANGILLASHIEHAKPSPMLWAPDQ